MKEHCHKLKVLLWLAIVCWQDGYSQIKVNAVYNPNLVYTSANPKTNPGVSEASVMQIQTDVLYSAKAPKSIKIGGIRANTAAGGKVILRVYAYSSSAANGKRGLLYQCTNTGSDGTSFVEQAEAKDEAWFKGVWNLGLGGLGSWKTTNLANSAKAWRVIKSEGGRYKKIFQETRMQVVIEVEAQNVSLANIYAIKIPTLGVISMGNIFPELPMLPVNAKVTLGSHRGDWQDITAPENTKNSIRDMFAENYDMVELDLWSTQDDSVIVFHDMGLNKRTNITGGVRDKTWNNIKDLYIKNRFDELIVSQNTKMETLGSILSYIKQQDPGGRVLLNLDRSANEMSMFKMVYQVMDKYGMLDRAIFKGRFVPNASTAEAPTVANIRQAFAEMFPNLSQLERDNKMRRMRFTPVLFDNNKTPVFTNDEAFAQQVKAYIDAMIDAGIADGFELNYKSYPVGATEFANSTNDNVFLLKSWAALGNKNFIEYVHSKNLPVGIFASVPEVCAIPDFNPTTGARIITTLVSGFVKENTDAPSPNYVPYVKDQSLYDFRGDWDFYIPAGADYVITDRPDALREYLKAIGRFK